jgi:hypothetical protein
MKSFSSRPQLFYIGAYFPITANTQKTTNIYIGINQKFLQRKIVMEETNVAVLYAVNLHMFMLQNTCNKVACAMVVIIDTDD